MSFNLLNLTMNIMVQNIIFHPSCQDVAQWTLPHHPRRQEDLEEGVLGPSSPEQWELPKCRKTQLLCDNTGRSLRQIDNSQPFFLIDLLLLLENKQRTRFLTPTRRLLMQHSWLKKSQLPHLGQFHSQEVNWPSCGGGGGHQKKLHGFPKIPEEAVDTSSQLQGILDKKEAAFELKLAVFIKEMKMHDLNHENHANFKMLMSGLSLYSIFFLTTLLTALEKWKRSFSKTKHRFKCTTGKEDCHAVPRDKVI